MRSKIFGLRFLKIEDENRYIFFLKISLLAYIQAFTPSNSFLKAAKMSSFEPSLIHPLRLLVFQQHPQNGVLLTYFSTWGTEIVWRR